MLGEAGFGNVAVKRIDGDAFNNYYVATLTNACGVAARIGARPLLRELELLAERARLDLAPARTAIGRRAKHSG